MCASGAKSRLQRIPNLDVRAKPRPIHRIEPRLKQQPPAKVRAAQVHVIAGSMPIAEVLSICFQERIDDARTHLHAHVTIGAGVSVGEDCELYESVTVSTDWWRSPEPAMRTSRLDTT